MIKIFDFASPVFRCAAPIGGVVYTPESFAQMNGRKIAVTVGKPAGEPIDVSDVMGMAKISIQQDGVYADVEFMKKGIKPPPDMNLGTVMSIRFIEQKPHMVSLNVMLATPELNGVWFENDTLTHK